MFTNELLSGMQNSFDYKKFLIIVIPLLVVVVIDTSVVKINDLIDKYFIPLQGKQILFSINCSLIMFFQFIAVKYVTDSYKTDRLNKSLRIKILYLISLTSMSVLGALLGFMMFELFYFSYYDTVISISIILLSYGTAAAFITWLAILFFSWFKSKRQLLLLLYFISMSIIAFNLLVAATLTSLKVAGRPTHAAEYLGASGDVINFRYKFLSNISNIASFTSFFSIWFTTATLMNSYREKLIRSIVYWILLSMPLAYFLITYFYQFTLARILSPYLQLDPLTVSIALSAFLALSKPIGGILFGLSFWKISRAIRYEGNIRTSMIIAGWGILLLFSTNQASTQVVAPYPPFGLATITVLGLAAFFMLLGIYNSAILVSANNKLRRSIQTNALRLLKPIGEVEMEKAVQKVVKNIFDDQEVRGMVKERTVELDEEELKNYVNFVIKEVKKDSS